MNKMLKYLGDRNNRLLILTAAAVLSGAVLASLTGCGGGTSGTGIGAQSVERVRGTVITNDGALLTGFSFTVAGSETTVVTDETGVFETDVSCPGPQSAADAADPNDVAAVDPAAVGTEGVSVTITDAAPRGEVPDDPAGGADPSGDGAPMPIEPGIGDGTSLPADDATANTAEPETTTVLVQVPEQAVSPVIDPAQDPAAQDTPAVAVDFSEVCQAAAVQPDSTSTMPAQEPGQDLPAEGPTDDPSLAAQ